MTGPDGVLYVQVSHPLPRKQAKYAFSQQACRPGTTRLARIFRVQSQLCCRSLARLVRISRGPDSLQMRELVGHRDPFVTAFVSNSSVSLTLTSALTAPDLSRHSLRTHSSSFSWLAAAAWIKENAQMVVSAQQNADSGRRTVDSHGTLPPSPRWPIACPFVTFFYDVLYS